MARLLLGRLMEDERRGRWDGRGRENGRGLE